MVGDLLLCDCTIYTLVNNHLSSLTFVRSRILTSNKKGLTFGRLTGPLHVVIEIPFQVVKDPIYFCVLLTLVTLVRHCMQENVSTF